MMEVLDSRALESDSYLHIHTAKTARHCTAEKHTHKNKHSEAFASETLAINRLILLNVYSILFCTDAS